MPFLSILNTTRAPAINPSTATDNLQVLQSLSEPFISSLLALYEQWHGSFASDIPRYSGIGEGGDISSVQIIRCTLETLLSIVPLEQTINFRNEILSKLLTAFNTESAGSVEEKNHAVGQCIILTGLLSTVIPSADSETAHIILRTLGPMLDREDVPILQKRAYFCLLGLCRDHPDFVISDYLADFCQLFEESILSLSIGSKKYRLRCLWYLANHLDPRNPDHIQFIMLSLAEVVLSLKDPSKKVRAIGQEVLLNYAKIMENSGIPFSLPDGSQKTASLSSFVGVLVGYLAAQNSHMQAAALLSIACVVFHMRNDDTKTVMVDVLHICYQLVGEGRELAKACLKYFKTCVKLLSDAELNIEIPAVMKSLFVDMGDNKNRFRNRVEV